MMYYYLAIDLDGIIVKFETVFDTEEEANDFADSIADRLVEFAYVQMTEKVF